MREKLLEYAADGAAWPLTANILDPIRSGWTLGKQTLVGRRFSFWPLFWRGVVVMENGLQFGMVRVGKRLKYEHGEIPEYTVSREWARADSLP